MFCNYARKLYIKLSGPTSYISWRNAHIRTIDMAYNVYEGNSTNKSLSPLIIMHGLFGSKQNWRGVGRALEEKTKRKIITVDARNHGDSPHIREHDSIHMAADIKELMRKMSISKSCVMGHSMGGRSVMYMALKHPQLVERAIVVDISPISIPRDFLSMEEIFNAMENINIPKNLTMIDGRAHAERDLTKVIDSKGTVDFILFNLRKKDDGTFYWTHNVNALRKNLRKFTDFASDIKGLPPFKGPMMFICGSLSNFVEPNSWPEIQKIFPNSEIHWLDTGHLVHFEKPAEFLELVVNFLKS